MKKILTFFLSLTCAASLLAQTADDAIGLTQTYREGTARTMAMGGAFTALGGDLGAIGINPASSGVLNASQFTFTPSLVTSRSTADYLGNSQSARSTGLNVSNFGIALNFDTGRYSGLVGYSFSFVFNKTANFRSSMQAAGTTASSSMLSAIAAGLDGYDWHSIDMETVSDPFSSSTAPWPGILAWNNYVLAPLSILGGQYANVNDAYVASTENYDAASDQLQIGGPLNQRFNRKTYGGNQEFAFNFGANLSDFLYLGANLNLYTLRQTTEEYYEEKAQNPAQFDDGFVSMDNSYWLQTRGSGINLKLGVIVTPIAGLRLGATFTTPTWYDLTDEWDYTMNTAFNNGNSYTLYSPTGQWDYTLTTPLSWSLGAAYTFWDRGLISVDYESTNYARTRLGSATRRSAYDDYSAENELIRSSFQRAGILRLGAEVRVTDGLSLRGGFQDYAPAAKGGTHRQAYSAGVGFNISPMFSVDLAWTRLGKQSDSFQLYDDYSSAVTVPTGVNTHSLDKAVCTLTLRF